MGNEEDRERRAEILSRLAEDVTSADIQMSLMIAALSSYRHDTVLRPFPPMFAGPAQDDRNYISLGKAVAKLPSITEMCSEIMFEHLTGIQKELVKWTLFTKRFSLKSCPTDKFQDITKMTGQVMPVTTPNHIFEVVYSSAVDEKFQEIRNSRPLLYACHGSRVENFHCILHQGLNAHMTKNALFGEGIYLSSELSVTMPYAPTGTGWDKSVLGDKLSCVAVCEIIDDPASVKCQSKDPKDGKTDLSRAQTPESMGGEVPEKYYIVRNNELVRVKYLLVYISVHKPKRNSRHWCAWLSGYWFLVMMLLYAFLLLLLGLYNSKFFQVYMRRRRR